MPKGIKKGKGGANGSPSVILHLSVLSDKLNTWGINTNQFCTYESYWPIKTKINNLIWQKIKFLSYKHANAYICTKFVNSTVKQQVRVMTYMHEWHSICQSMEIMILLLVTLKSPIWTIITVTLNLGTGFLIQSILGITIYFQYLKQVNNIDWGT